MNTETKLGIAGAVLLALGAFMPLVSMPIIGSINYFMNGKGDGTIILILAAAIGFGALNGKHLPGLICGGISLVLILFTFFNMRAGLSNMKEELAGNPFAGLAEASIQMQWGWIVLIAGAACSIRSWDVARKRAAQEVTS